MDVIEAEGVSPTPIGRRREFKYIFVCNMYFLKPITKGLAKVYVYDPSILLYQKVF